MPRTISDLKREAFFATSEKITLINLTDTDFTHNFEGKPYTVPAGETATFDKLPGEHLRDHLAKYMVNRGKYTNYEEAYAKALKEVTITV